MDNNNMNVVDYNNLQNNNMGQDAKLNNQGVPVYQEQPIQQVDSVQPVYQEQSNFQQAAQTYQQPQYQDNIQTNMGSDQVVQNVQPVMPNTDVPTIDVAGTPSEIFGAPVNEQQVNEVPGVSPIVPPVGPEEAVQPKYGYATNEDKPNLNADSNASIKFIIFLAILMLGFIVALPYLSNLIK